MKFTNEGITLHQSDLKHHCLEHLRMATVAVGPRTETDAATVGTLLHATIEEELKNGFFADENECVEWAAAAYVLLLEEYQAGDATYVMSTFKDHTAAITSLANLARSWYRSDLRTDLLTDDNKEVEWFFDLPFGEFEVKKHGRKSEIIPVRLAGMADLVWRNRVDDFKSASSEYKQWECQRWGRQPDVYTWAAAESGLIVPDKNDEYHFNFQVFVRRAVPVGVQTVPVVRTSNHWAWLRTIVGNVVNLAYNMGLDRPWPLDDQHVLCSPKWCEFWSQCKGSQVSGVTWR